jgi:hypothetical protein
LVTGSHTLPDMVKTPPTGSLTLFERNVEQLLIRQIRFRVQLFLPQPVELRVWLPAGTSTQCRRKCSSLAIANQGASFHLNEFNRHSIGSFNHGRTHVAPRVNLFENLDPLAF